MDKHSTLFGPLASYEENNFFRKTGFLQLKNRIKEQECDIVLGWKGLPGKTL
jgi:hypothetical protein